MKKALACTDKHDWRPITKTVTYWAGKGYGIYHYRSCQRCGYSEFFDFKEEPRPEGREIE